MSLRAGEIVVDLFAGGDAAVAAIAVAVGRDIDVAAVVWRFVRHLRVGDGCWEWTGSRLKRPDGTLSYGFMDVGKRRFLAHRLSWLFARGPIPEGHGVLHRCDNPPCVRPSDLFTGTQAVNLADMRAKGRGHFNRFAAGEAHPNAKLDADRVRAIRAMRQDGASLGRIAAAFRVDRSTVHAIVRGEIWKAVT